MMLPPITARETAAELVSDVLHAFVELATNTIRDAGVFRVSLSGGSTPQRLYREIAKADLDFSKIEWYWGDERNVPHDHADSNFRMVKEALLDPAGIAERNVFPVPVRVDDPAAAANAYQATLRQNFGTAVNRFEVPPAEGVSVAATGGGEVGVHGDRTPGEAIESETFPAWDLVLLGMGDDAHTASLFPDTAALEVCDAWFVENWVDKFAAYRYTLTVPAINAGREIWFLITGAGKREALAKVLGSDRQPLRYPAQLIRPTRYFVTTDALESGEK